MAAGEDRLACVVCHEGDAVPGSFCCMVCLPEPEPAPEPEAWQPSLLEATA